jgi:serine protease Do
VALTLWRGGQERQLTVRLAEMPRTAEADEAAPSQGESDNGYGLSVAPVDGRRGGRGVEVTGVDPDGPAAQAGIREGDVLEEVNGRSLRSASDLRMALAQAKGRPALVLVRRGEDTLYLALRA